jgi:hypothetical protein
MSSKAPIHELKQKHFVLTLKQKMEIGKRPVWELRENWSFLGQSADGPSHSPYMLYNGEFTVICWAIWFWFNVGNFKDGFM